MKGRGGKLGTSLVSQFGFKLSVSQFGCRLSSTCMSPKQVHLVVYSSWKEAAQAPTITAGAPHPITCIHHWWPLIARIPQAPYLVGGRGEEMSGRDEVADDHEHLAGFEKHEGVSDQEEVVKEDRHGCADVLDKIDTLQ